MGKIFLVPKAKSDNAIYFRKKFTAPQSGTATLHLSALGCYKAWLNGVELDPQVFLPGRTSYGYRVQVQEYDISSKIVSGENILAVRLVKGWYRKPDGLYCEMTLDGQRGLEVQH